jgi:hypothetical protein
VCPNALLSYGCSPAIEDFGIRLAAPTEVTITDGVPFARIMVCGTYFFERDYLGLADDFAESIILVAACAITHRSWASPARLRRCNTSPSRARPGDDNPDVLRPYAVGGYFNQNLAELLRLEPIETRYFAYASLGSYVSNVVEIAVRHAKGAS